MRLNNIFIADDFGNSGIEILKQKFNVSLFKGLTNSELLKKIEINSIQSKTRDAVILRSVRKVDTSFLKCIKSHSNVRLICTVSSGFDNIDVKTARKLGIDVINVHGGNNISAAEFTMALILSVSKGIIPADRLMKQGRFQSKTMRNFELFGKTLGIIGVGKVGSYTARLAKAFGMKILGNDIKKELAAKYRFIKFLSLNKLLKDSDIVTIHTPLDNSTINLVNSENMKLLKPGAILINCSRGGTVDESALINTLKRGKLYYAAFDVFEKEPDFNKRFCSLPNVILTPHLAGKTLESFERMSVIAAEKIARYLTKGRSSVKFVN